MPTWLKVTLNILLNIVLVVCAVLFTIYTDVFDKYKKYTYQDLQDAYNTGYAQASAMMADLQTKINELTESLSQKLQQVSDLQLQINDLQNQNSELETEKQDLEQQILDLQDIISQKDVEIADLKAEIERLNAELEIYANQDLDYVMVVFLVEGEIYEEITVRKSGSILIDITEPEDSTKNRHFWGWAVNDEIIDITTYEFTENTVLKAVFSTGFINIILKIDSLSSGDGTSAGTFDGAVFVTIKQLDFNTEQRLILYNLGLCYQISAKPGKYKVTNCSANAGNIATVNINEFDITNPYDDVDLIFTLSAAS